MTTANKRLVIIILSAFLILLVPLCAMLFTHEVNWTVLDFIVAGTLLFGAGLLCELALRKVKTIKYRIIICIAILLLFALVWIELAVGIFNSPIAGN